MGLNGDDLGVSICIYIYLYIYIYIYISIFVVCLVGFLRSAGVGLRVRGLGFRVRMICRWGGFHKSGFRILPFLGHSGGLSWGFAMFGNLHLRGMVHWAKPSVI